jgi:hypothetical protein
MAKEFDVGYGKPPKHSQFRKGRSGNPKGRPKGCNNFSTDLKETLTAPVNLKERGKSKIVSTQKAALMRLREKALGGDARELDRLLELARAYNNETLVDDAHAALAPSDADILESFVKRRQKNTELPACPKAGEACDTEESGTSDSE